MIAHICRKLLRARPDNSALGRGLRKWKSRYISSQSPIIIGGCPRSGTTLTRVILDAHPNIVCGPESSLLAARFTKEELIQWFEITAPELDQVCQSATDHAHFIELFFTRYAAQQGKTRWAEKTPANVRHLAYVFRNFPKAKFVHVIRDGRDVVCSLRTHPKYRLVDGQPVPTKIRRPLRGCIQQWLRDTTAGMAWRGHPNYFELRYEDLVENTAPTLQRLCAFIGEPWSPALLEHQQQQRPRQNPHYLLPSANAIQPISAKAIGRWRTELTEPELRLFFRLTARRLVELGYPFAPPNDLKAPHQLPHSLKTGSAGKSALVTEDYLAGKCSSGGLRKKPTDWAAELKMDSTL